MAKKDSLRKVFDQIWPKTKKELENVIANAKEALAKSESYLREVSGKGVEQTKKLPLTLKREKLYYDLGKAAAAAGPSKLSSSQRVNALLKKIKELNKQIKK